MLNANDLLNAVKRAAVEAVEAGQPSDFCFGKVVSTKPLKIFIEQKMTLGSAQLVLTQNVSDYETEIVMNEEKQSVKIKNGLVKGDEVILLKKKGGQKYLVLDRVVNT